MLDKLILLLVEDIIEDSFELFYTNWRWFNKLWLAKIQTFIQDSFIVILRKLV